MFKVNNRIIFIDPQTGKEFEGIIVNISDYREPSLKYAIALDEPIGTDDCKDDLVFCGNNDLKPLRKFSLIRGSKRC